MKSLARSASVFLTLILCALLAGAQQVPVPAQQTPVAASNNVQLVIEGKVIKVYDGDTVTVLDQNNQKFTIRLHGIDAPELKQEFGSVSQKNLARLVLGKQVSIFWTKVDKYRRTVGTIKIDGRDINIEQVKAGLAWHFKKYQDEQEPEDRVSYAAAEQAARAAKLGLWEDPNPIVPGDWRAGVKEKRWGPPPPEGTIIGNSNSKKYHRPDCEGYRNMAERNRVFFKTVAEAEAAGYKRAGNCPAEPQVAQAKAASGASVAATQVVTPSAAAPVVMSSSSRSLQPAPSSPLPVATTASGSLFSPLSSNGQAAAAADAKIIGNSNSKKYHRQGCPGYRTVSEKNRVLFKSAVEAEAAGYKLAGNCPAETQAAQTTPAANVPAKDPATTPQVVPPAATAPAVATSSSTSLPPTPPSPVPGATAPANPPPSASTETSQIAKVIGNKNSKIYHLPGCASYRRVSEKNQVLFDTAEDAEKAGFKLASNCSANKNAKEN